MAIWFVLLFYVIIHNGMKKTKNLNMLYRKVLLEFYISK
jgi:hypothetical protein